MPGIKVVRVLYGCGNITGETQGGSACVWSSQVCMLMPARTSTVVLFRARTRNEDASNRHGWENSCESRDLPMVREINSPCVDGWPSRSDFRFRIFRWQPPRFDTPSRPGIVCYVFYSVPFPLSLSLCLSLEGKQVSSLPERGDKCTGLSERRRKVRPGRGYPRSGKFEFESRSRSVACGHGSRNLHMAQHVKGDDEVERPLWTATCFGVLNLEDLDRRCSNFV